MNEQLQSNKQTILELDSLLKSVINSLNDQDNFQIMFDNKLTKE